MDRLELRFGGRDDDLVEWLKTFPRGLRATAIKWAIRQTLDAGVRSPTAHAGPPRLEEILAGRKP